VTDGVGSHADASSGIGDVPSIRTAVNRSANAPENVRIPREQAKLPNSPMEAAKQCSDGFGNRTDASSGFTDARIIENNAKMAENATKNVRTRRIGQRTQNSPSTRETATAKHASR